MLNDFITDETVGDGCPVRLKENLAMHLLQYSLRDALIRSLYADGYGFKAEDRTALTEDGVAMRSIKFGLYRGLNLPTKNAAHQRTLALRSGLDESDLDLLDAHKFPRLHKWAKKLGTRYNALSYERFQHLVTKVSSKEADNIRGFLCTKMMFLTNYGLSIDDIRAEILATTYRNLLITYPKYDGYAHFRNSYLRYSRQAGQGMIQKYTSVSNNVFKDGHLLKFSLDCEYGELGNHTALEIGFGGHSPDRAEEEVYLKEFLDSLNERQVRLLELLTGINSKFFETFLSKRSRYLQKDYAKGVRSPEILESILTYLSLPYHEYHSLVRLAKGTPAPKEAVMLRC